MSSAYPLIKYLGYLLKRSPLYPSLFFNIFPNNIFHSISVSINIFTFTGWNKWVFKNTKFVVKLLFLFKTDHEINISKNVIMSCPMLYIFAVHKSRNFAAVKLRIVTMCLEKAEIFCEHRGG